MNGVVRRTRAGYRAVRDVEVWTFLNPVGGGLNATSRHNMEQRYYAYYFVILDEVKSSSNLIFR